MLGLVLSGTMGASCSMDRRTNWPAAPVLFQQPPDLGSLIQVINSHTTRVRQLSVNRGRLTVAGVITTLRAELYYEQPRRFRLFAETTLTGRELDMGSNDERYWMWLKPMRPPAVLHGRHDQFEQSLARQFLPVSPDWLVQALGLVYLDPAGRHEGPRQIRPGVVQIETHLPSAGGELLRVLEVDEQRGLVLAQHLYDAFGTEVASAVASDHRFDPLQGVSLPARVVVNLPTTPLTFTFEADSYAVNQPLPDPMSLWAMPDLSGSGYDYFDVANPYDMQRLLPESSQRPVAARHGATLHSTETAFDPYAPPAAGGWTEPAAGVGSEQRELANRDWGTVKRLARPSNEIDSSPPARAALRRLPPFSVIR